MPSPAHAAYDDEQLHPLAFLRTQQPARAAKPLTRRTAATPAPEHTLSAELHPPLAAPENRRRTHRQLCCCAARTADLMPLLYTVEQAAELLAIPANWLQRAAGDGRIPATYVGKYLRFCDADLDELIASARRRPVHAFDPRLEA